MENNRKEYLKFYKDLDIPSDWKFAQYASDVIGMACFTYQDAIIYIDYPSNNKNRCAIQITQFWDNLSNKPKRFCVGLYPKGVPLTLEGHCQEGYTTESFKELLKFFKTKSKERNYEWLDFFTEEELIKRYSNK